ncbi:MAG: glycyl-radical enzyme activating protein [Clostridia bacterium]|nr:glycyl-radical enzyme activating protein [Clostridia bacterium]
MGSVKARIADIQRASIHDGPGIRTTVFFKGCPLRCAWCHNPECISFEKETLYYPEKCIGCGKCSEGCFSGARVVCGRDMTAEEILETVLLDRDYYAEEGGVTFSGGEPLAQREALGELIRLAKREGIGTAIETSLILFDEEILGEADLVMADLKIWDEERHRAYTGVSNREILSHFKLLDRLGTPVIARTPVIPGVNDDRENVEKTRDFLRSLRNVIRYELLPYHPLGEDKRRALGLPPAGFPVPDRGKMEELRRYADLRG